DRAPNGRKSRAERPVPLRQREEIQEVPRGLSARRRRYADTRALPHQTNSAAQVAFRHAGADPRAGARAAPPDRTDPRPGLRPPGQISPARDLLSAPGARQVRSLVPLTPRPV